MNKNQKEILQSQLNSEKQTIKELKQVYTQALKDCAGKISELSSRADLEPQNIQSIIYQKQYQEAIKAQLEGVLSELQSKEYATVSDYLTRCYQEGYTGVMYDLMGQGIPLIMPIDQEQVTKAIQTDSKLSKTLYARMGEDINKLKTSVRDELSRGIANGSSWNEMASNLATNFKNTPFNKAYNNSIRIARTEGHRIQNQSALDAQHKAKSKGADVVKQWDSTLDGATRDTHRLLDGQIREVDEPFEVGGMKADAPGMFGDPAEDCNCRCCLLQRARWALDDKELETLKERAEYFGLDKTKDFEEYKEKYLKISDEDIDNTELQEWTKKWSQYFEDAGVEYNEVQMNSKILTDEEIIKLLGGGDKTGGSCSSLSLAYLGQKKGMDVVDFRGGNSQQLFADKGYKKLFFEQSPSSFIFEKGKNTTAVGKTLLEKVETGKEYILNVGIHSAIVRKTDDGILQYLELQTENKNGWHDFGNIKSTLVNRFGTSSQGFKGMNIYEGSLVDIDKFDLNYDLKHILGYCNTSVSKQVKGIGGYAK